MILRVVTRSFLCVVDTLKKAVNIKCNSASLVFYIWVRPKMNDLLSCCNGSFPFNNQPYPRQALYLRCGSNSQI